MNVTGPEEVDVTDGDPITSDGTGFVTANVELAPVADAEPVEFEAVPAAMEMPRVPLPVISDIVTVRVDVPDPLTETVPLAVPVLLTVISLATKAFSATFPVRSGNFVRRSISMLWLSVPPEMILYPLSMNA